MTQNFESKVSFFKSLVFRELTGFAGWALKKLKKRGRERTREDERGRERKREEETKRQRDKKTKRLREEGRGRERKGEEEAKGPFF